MLRRSAAANIAYALAVRGVGYRGRGERVARALALANLEAVADWVAARDWIEMVSRASPPGLYPYQPFREVTAAMTAEGMFVQQLLGADRTEVRMASSAEYILAHPPRWKPDGNTYYWYYATLALFQHQGTAWKQWNEAVKEQLVSHQKVGGKAAGSWDPDDRWALVGGRIYQTAMCTLTLEVYYRYLPSFVSDE